MDYLSKAEDAMDDLPKEALEVPWIDEGFYATRVTPVRMDQLWKKGWRHFGPQFVRYSMREWNGRDQVVKPLRVVLSQYEPSKSHRRIHRRNADLTVKIERAVINAERLEMFHRHKERFNQCIPESLEAFLGPHPEKGPCRTMEIAVYDGSTLLAASYLDVGRLGVSAVYAMFEPTEEKRSLGIFTMLSEIAYAKARGCLYYYLGYVFREPSELDYKNQFRGLQWFDWRGNWWPDGA
jgi:arginyl-tRNA--protein-N-Asp/Glu arginylyltransferase